VSPADPLPRTGLFVVDQLRAEVGPGTVQTWLDTAPALILGGCDWRLEDDDTVSARRKDALVGRWFAWGVATCDRFLVEGKLPPGSEPTPTPEQVEALTAAVEVLARAELAPAPPPARPVELLSLSRSWAERLTYRHVFWHEGDTLMWAEATPAPILAGGRGREAPAPPPVAGRWFRRRAPRPGGAALTPEALAEWARLHPSAVPVGEAPDWTAVVTELGKMLKAP